MPLFLVESPYLPKAPGNRKAETTCQGLNICLDWCGSWRRFLGKSEAESGQATYQLANPENSSSQINMPHQYVQIVLDSMDFPSVNSLTPPCPPLHRSPYRRLHAVGTRPVSPNGKLHASSHHGVPATIGSWP